MVLNANFTGQFSLNLNKTSKFHINFLFVVIASDRLNLRRFLYQQKLRN